MSDPVTNAEVEDVLSSIRRLVSGEKRAAPEAQASPEPQAPEAPEAPADRLVLTPALRVEDPEAAPAEEAPAEQEAPDTSTLSKEEIARLLDEVIEPEEEELVPVDDFDTAAEAEEPEEEADDPMPVFHHRRKEDLKLREPVAPKVVPAAEEDRAAELTAKIAQLETAIGNIAEEWEPDGSTPDANAGTEPPAMAWEDEAETREVVASEEPAREEPTPEPAPSRGATVSEFSRVQGAFASHAGHREPEEERSLDLGGEEQILDEEMLRDLVSEIVRQELQGALGERITRNVRKLVRREIHRALTAQDLE